MEEVDKDNRRNLLREEVKGGRNGPHDVFPPEYRAVGECKSFLHCKQILWRPDGLHSVFID